MAWRNLKANGLRNGITIRRDVREQRGSLDTPWRAGRLVGVDETIRAVKGILILPCLCWREIALAVVGYIDIPMNQVEQRV